MTRYVVLDTETTGISPERDRIVWVAVAILEHRTVTERWSTFLDPGPNSRVRVAGIDLAGQPTFADVALQLTDMLHGGVLRVAREVARLDLLPLLSPAAWLTIRRAVRPPAADDRPLTSRVRR